MERLFLKAAATGGWICMIFIQGWAGAGTYSDPGFKKSVKPILMENCVRCHGGVHQKAGLSFLSRSSTTATLESGRSAIVPGDLNASEMIRRVTTHDPDEQMPPDTRLSPQEISILQSWVASGAHWPQHWSFSPLKISEKESVLQSENPVDGFIRNRLEGIGWTMAPSADRRTLIRRLYLDLTGLLPEPEAVEEFVHDTDPDAWETLVDQTLNSPHFGERWGRYWLDQARYADSDGYEKDKPRPNAWRYRDWVIQSINADMPLSQFTRWQLAGDILYHRTKSHEKNPEMLVASAFHRQTLFNTEGGVDPEEDRTKRVIDRVNTTASIWLGLTIGCAQCHSHPYDPITHNEFYKLYAFFNNDNEIEAEVPVRYGWLSGEMMKTSVMGSMPADSRRSTHVFHRGDFLQPSIESGEVLPGAPDVLTRVAGPVNGNDRLALADWLVNSSNPVPKRVLVNQIWEKLLGRGLVSTPDDWGARGASPSHPLLLDWLAFELERSGWSRKHIIKTILLSETYRQSAIHRPEYEDLDPENSLYFRQNRRRLEAESIRDIFLQAAGLLDTTIGGPSVFPPLAPDVAAQSYANNFRWKTSEGGNKFRRGLYTFFKRTAPHPNLIVFDCSDSNASQAVRMVSNTPLQALTTLQNEVFLEAARGFGERLWHHARQSEPENNDDYQTGTWTFAFQTALSRPPAEMNEIQPLMDLFSEALDYYSAHPKAAREFAGGVASGVAFPDPAGLAAWVVAARAILNLDEFINRN